MKNVKSEKQPNREHLKIRKRLLLIKVKELYAEYKKKFDPDDDGKKTLKFDQPTSSTLALVAHILYVSVYVHQNVKLILDAVVFLNEKRLFYV